MNLRDHYLEEELKKKLNVNQVLKYNGVCCIKVKNIQLFNTLQLREQKPFIKKQLDLNSLRKNYKEFMRNRLILNSKLGLRIEKHDVFTKALSKITLRANND